MKKELQEKLFRDFPLLYSEAINPSILCPFYDGHKNYIYKHGILCDDKDYELLYELSSKLEPLIKQEKENTDQTQCYNCRHSLSQHNDDGCMIVRKSAFRLHTVCPKITSLKTNKVFGVKFMLNQDWKYTKFRWLNILNKVLRLSSNLGLNKKHRCQCKCFSFTHPRVISVGCQNNELRFVVEMLNSQIKNIIKEVLTKN